MKSKAVNHQSSLWKCWVE